MPLSIRQNCILLVTSEAVQLSGLSREHIQRLLRAKKIEGTKLGHDWLVYEDSLKAFLAQPRHPGPIGRAKHSLTRHPEPICMNDNQKYNGDIR